MTDPLDSLEQRLARFEERQLKILVGLGKVEEKLSDLNGDVAGVMAEIGGAPAAPVRGERETLRWRVHKLENDRYAAEAAHAALEAAKASNRQAWSLWQKLALFAFAAAAAIESGLRIFGLTG